MLVAALTGCESLQRKLTRKRKGPAPRPTPIVQFQDYTRAMTPMDRYRKHSLIFDYWNGELLSSVDQEPYNPKRARRSIEESLVELRQMRALVDDEAAARLDPLVEEREQLQRQLQVGHPGFGTASALKRQLEAQTTQIQREFTWRKMEDHLRPRDAQ
ncbi:MAG: hypothetical protein HY601_03365 [Candidatus Omnitrophica bacterium]|nr:hypothetical protein [Candidatus Omnitrophota bacterium]